MDRHFFKIMIHVKGKPNPLKGIRWYYFDDIEKVYDTVYYSIVRTYRKDDILKIDIWPLSPTSEELKDHFRKMEQQKKK